MTQHKLTNIDGRKLSVKQDLFTWSNLISLTRILLTGPILWIHASNGYESNVWVVLLILIAIFSDYADGWVARKRNEISELGKVLDPVSDKLMAFFLFGYTVLIGWIPVWYFCIGVARDLMIMTGSAWIKRLRGKVAMAVMSGKISVNVMAVYWVAIFFCRDAIILHQWLMWLSVFVMGISFIHYGVRFYRICKGAEFN
ncbi:MAG: CDP-alcohol phosphatidyltransferase family protein [Balneolaceae bacterium]